MHPLFGMNPRCLLYEGFRTILLSRGASISAPEQIWPNRPFQTDLSVVIETSPVDGDGDGDGDGSQKEGVVDAVMVGEEEGAGDGGSGGGAAGDGSGVHMTRLQRLYDGSHVVSTSSNAFLTRGGLDYTIA